jgi:hypothetical protein
VSTLVAILLAVDVSAFAQAQRDRIESPVGAAAKPMRITLRPSTLAEGVSELAGHDVKVLYAKVVGVFNPSVFVVETATRDGGTWASGFRDRVIVLIHPGALRVPATLVVGSTVTVLGVARTLLGVQVTREVPWPPPLDRKLVDRLEIRAAVLAHSVQTPEGVELTAVVGAAARR